MLTKLLQQMSATVIGVSIETDALRMAESYAGRVTRCASKPYPPGVTPSAVSFPAFLRQCLMGFSSHFQTVPVWATGSLPSLQTRYLTVPTGRQRAVGAMAYWAFRKDLPFDDAQSLFDYGVEGGSGSGGDAKLNVTAYTVLREETDALGEMFAKAGVKLAGQVIPAFAMRAVMQAGMGGQSGTRFGVFAGEDASTVIIVKDGQVCSSRVFKTGMNAILGVVRDADPGCPLSVACERVQALLRAGSEPVNTVMAQRVRDVFDRLIQQIERTLNAYLNEHPGDTIRGMDVMGPLAGFDVLVGEMHARFGVELPVSEGAGRADAGWQGLAALAAGVSLSHPDRTPNLLCVSARREQEARRAWLSVLAALLLGLTGALLHLYKGVVDYGNVRLARNLDTERARLAAYVPPVDNTMLQALTARRVADLASLKRMTRHWLAPAVLRALGPLTPESIRLTSIDADFEASGLVKIGRNKEGVAKRSGVLKLSGLARGVQDTQRSTLAAYALRLEDSPLFSRAAVSRITEGQAGGEPVVIFEIELDVEGGIGAVAAPIPPSAEEAKP